ncbi:MAG TPA: ROK family transcriptional regulator [Acidimicrobiales bacterium]|nr:ROK family transcriptional regulator [Acidimicrobiales bacterium]
MARPLAEQSHTPRAHAAVQEDLRRNNLAALVRNLHLSGPLTRSQLTARTGLNRSTVAGLVGELASIGLVRESPSPSGGATGRPSLVVSLDAERVWVLAVELAAEALVVARVGPGGHLHERLAQPRDTRRKLAPADAAATIGALARQLMNHAPAGAQLVGAAVAIPGIVRRGEGFVHLAPNLVWRDVPFGALLSGHLPDRLGVAVANEADLGALAECARGAAVGHRHVIYVSGNTGVGAGIVVDGALLAGRSGYAGEVGHMKVNPDGHRCRCGARGCWESEIGATAMLRRAGRRASDVRAGVSRVLSDAQVGDPKASKAVRETGQWIGRGAANLINIFNPDLVVFGGALRNVYLAAEAVVVRELQRQVLPQAGAEAAVVAAGLGADSVLLGAAELALADFLAGPMDSWRRECKAGLRGPAARRDVSANTQEVLESELVEPLDVGRPLARRVGVEVLEG